MFGFGLLGFDLVCSSCVLFDVNVRVLFVWFGLVWSGLLLVLFVC